jgi:plasmid stability protein
MKYKRLSIRNFPADLDKKLKALAKKNHRSLTQEIIFALEQHLERQTSKPSK